MKAEAARYFKTLQDSICLALEESDGSGKFKEDLWERKNSTVMHGGGGRTRIIQNGRVFEQGGVNFSEVHGVLPADMCKKIIAQDRQADFYATGISLVIHPGSPLVPTTHANFRYLTVDEYSWFGGGMDLTPYFLVPEDCVHFHSTIKTACDQHNPEYYPAFKKWCDEYFYLPHRGESRGIGGVFFDYLGREEGSNMEAIFAFVKSLGDSFVKAYIPIVEQHKQKSYTEKQKSFQLLRRGRYVEFNLLYDRGTQFGLQTGGRTESILMSLPPHVRWEYCAEYPNDSDEKTLIDTLMNPRDWI